MTTISHWNATSPSRRRTARVMLVAAAILLLLASVAVGHRVLGGGSSSPSSSAGVGESGASPAAGTAAASRPDVPGPAAVASVAGTRSAGATAIVTPKLARTAWLGVEVTNLSASSAQVRSVAAEAGGTVTYENVVTGTTPSGSSSVQPPLVRPSTQPDAGQVSAAPVGVDEARLTLSVPAARLDAVLADLARLGTVSYRSSQTQDVTDTYVDTQARIAPAKASVARVQALLAEATDLKQVVLIESELSKRQADLDSLTQRFAQLEQQTTMSDVTVTLWTDATAPAASDNGFVVDLTKAWTGLLGSVSVIIAGLATLLPWLLLLGLLAWAGLRLVRRRSPATPAGLAPTSTPTTPTSPTSPTSPTTAQHTE